MKKEKLGLYILRLAVTLLLIAGVVGAALAGVNAITKDARAKIQEEKTQKAISLVLPGVEGFAEKAVPAGHDLVSTIYAAGDSFAVEVAPAGFGGKIIMMVGVAGGEVTGISVISHAETPNLGAIAAANSAKGEAFRGQFTGTGAFSVGENVDAISGATITSKAVANGVNAALDAVKALG